MHLRARPVVEPFHGAVNKELDRLLANGTLASVETSPSASPIVAAGMIQVCADFSADSNDALENMAHPIPARASEMSVQCPRGQEPEDDRQ